MGPPADGRPLAVAGATCIVTGASRGIGRRVATDLVRDGASVAFVATNRQRLDESVRGASPAGKARGFECDVSDTAAVERMVGEVRDAFGPVDLLVNNAGIEPIGTVAELASDDIERTMAVNYFGVVHCVKAVLPDMLERGRGCIVNMTSGAARFPLPGGAAYCASKAAIEAFSESLYNEVRGAGVQVLLVSPGYVPETDMAQAHAEARGIPPKYTHRTLEQVSSAVRKAIGTDAFRLVLPRYLTWAPVAKELFPRASLRRVAKLQAGPKTP